jgi:hypothetical protein
MDRRYIQVSTANPRYFETTDGKPFIPNGPNMPFPRFAREPAEVVEYYRSMITSLAEAGGNFIRIWLGAPCFEIESKAEGQFEEQQLSTIAQVVRMCEETGVKIKFTLEHFRTLEPRQEAESFPGAASFVKDVYHSSRGGSLTSIAEFLTTPGGEAVYKRRLDALAERFSDSEAIMAWELWNEVNCTGPMEHWAPWSERMLVELKKRFPHHLTVQSLGSFCSLQHHLYYDWLGQLPGNDFYQAHRYLDLGAAFDVCRGPMDILCADTIRELRDRNLKTPVILAEGGAVEPNHSGPSHLYAADTQGMILHDVLFAPFFAGSAAAGQCWHWEKYIAKNGLWWHFGRFAKAVAGIDPRAEDYQPFQRESRRLRLYGLRGRTHTLVWCRDKSNTWASELDGGQAPQTISGERMDVRGLGLSAIRDASFYNPWTDAEGPLDLAGSQLVLPDFERSLVLRLNTHE